MSCCGRRIGQSLRRLCSREGPAQGSCQGMSCGWSAMAAGGPWCNPASPMSCRCRKIMACFNGVHCHRVEVVVEQKLSHAVLLQGKLMNVMPMFEIVCFYMCTSMHMSLACRYFSKAQVYKIWLLLLQCTARQELTLWQWPRIFQATDHLDFEQLFHQTIPSSCQVLNSHNMLWHVLQEVIAPPGGGYLMLGDDVIISHCQLATFDASKVHLRFIFTVEAVSWRAQKIANAASLARHLFSIGGQSSGAMKSASLPIEIRRLLALCNLLPSPFLEDGRCMMFSYLHL